MPPKRLRRSSPSAQGLFAGERLKRAKLSGHDYLAWAWVGTEVNDAADITQEHRLATCGFADSSTFQFCSNKYVPKLKPPDELAKTGETQKVEGELEDDVIVVSDDESSTCSLKACKNNPNCLNYLGQEKWENEDKACEAFINAADLGKDPNDDSRLPDIPVGLRNLGATCYANAFLQVWFQDIPFRSGVFNCQPSPDDTKFEESPIFQLQVTFAALQQSKQIAFNPVKLVESLKLRTTEQQDAQEFSKLFMAHLDTEFQQQANPSLKSLIADQLQGKQVYATVCAKCHNRSERENEFLEIEVNLTNNAKLEERIAALLQPESLHGDNQYLCARCDSLQDAERLTELTHLPPVLHFSLLRFVYDFETMERKKSKQAISFPEQLDMGQFIKAQPGVPPLTAQDTRYHLRGVLLHKGTSAYHGHYEAQVFDVKSQCWFQFNDETVTKIESIVPRPRPKPQPKASISGSQTSGKSVKSQMKPKASQTKKKPAKADSDVEIIDEVSSGKSGSPPTEGSNYIMSRDAYMLIYARSSPDTNSSQKPPSRKRSHSATDGKMDHRDDVPIPPLRATKVVEALNHEHERACEDFVDRLQDAEARFREVRERVIDIYRSWQLSDNTEPNMVVSRQTLESWLLRHLSKKSKKSEEKNPDAMDTDAETCTNTLSNDDIVCTHGRLDPNKASNMKRIREAAYDRIVSENDVQFSHAFRSSDVCEECVKELFIERLYQNEHPRLVSLFDEVSPVTDDQRAHWISKQWLKDWRLAKPKMHKSSQSDPPPNDPEYDPQVRCEHGGLTPNVMSRRRISEQAYELLKGVFPQWVTLSTDDETCDVCEALVHLSKEDKRGARIQAEEEKAKLKHMNENGLNGNTKLLENVPCAIVPSQFVRSWKSWLSRPAELVRPDSVDNTPFICQHGLLNVDPNSLNDLEGNVAVIMRGDWDVLETLYPAGPLISLENTGNHWTHEPAVCETCRKEKKSNYDMTELTIRVLGADDPIPTPETYSAKTVDRQDTQTTLVTYGSRKVGTLRQSKRIRQVKVGRRRRVTVTPAMTIKDLKVQIQEELDIPTISQRLYYQGHELEDNALTIGALGVLTNDVMDLREEIENVDLLGSGSDTEPRRREQREEGQGFGGTLLGSSRRTSSTPHTPSQHEDEAELPDRACPACTFQNEPDTLACAMCDTLLTMSCS